MITRSVLLPVSASEAFALFTERAGDWWPEGRRHTGDPRSAIRFASDGRFFERGGDGREVDLGKVRVWQPPGLLVLDFYMGTDAAHPTEVTVTFVAEGSGTRVTVEHRPTPASEELWNKRSPMFDRSWELVLAALAVAAAAPLS